MQSAWLVAAIGLGAACGGNPKSPTTAKSSSPTAESGSADTSQRSSDDPMAKLATEMMSHPNGTGLKEAVDRVIKALGQPDVIEGDDIVWYELEPKGCVRLSLGTKGDYVDGLDFERTSDDPSLIASEQEKFQVCTERANAKHQPVPAIPEPAQYKLDAQTRSVLALWRDRKFDQLLALAAPRLRAQVTTATLARMAALYAPATGKLRQFDGPLSYSLKNFNRVASGVAKFEKGEVRFEVGFEIVDGKPMVANFDLTLSESMRMKQDPADAEKRARHALDLLLAEQFGKFAALAAPAFATKLREAPEMPDKMRDFFKTKLGKVKSIKLAEQRACDNDGPAHCVDYEITAAKDKALATLIMKFVISEWQVDGFNLTAKTR